VLIVRLQISEGKAVLYLTLACLTASSQLASVVVDVVVIGKSFDAIGDARARFTWPLMLKNSPADKAISRRFLILMFPPIVGIFQSQSNPPD
jgi:hypothetical protein